VELAAQATERTTAATDAILTVASLLVLQRLRRVAPHSFQRAVWLGAVGCLAVASALAAAAHGLTLAAPVRQWLWQPLWLTLGAMIALFVVGAIGDWRGEPSARRALGPMLAAAVAFYLVTRLTGGNFLAFVIYEAAGLLFALTVYLALAIGRRAPGAAAMAAALAVSLAAGAVQAGTWRAELFGWPFDHNGLFHLMQLVGLPLLVIGLGRLLCRTPSLADRA
jgi:hypothetical protein